MSGFFNPVDGAIPEARSAATIADLQRRIAGLERRLSTGDGSFVGMIVPAARTASPAGWLLCDGSSVNRWDYPELFAVMCGVSSPWGGVTSTQFKVPDLRGRVPCGSGIASGLTANRVLGTQIGSESHTHTFSVPNHYHVFTISMREYYGIGNPADGSPGAYNYRTNSWANWYNPGGLEGSVNQVSDGQTGVVNTARNLTDGETAGPSNASSGTTGTSSAHFQPTSVVNFFIRAR